MIARIFHMVVLVNRPPRLGQPASPWPRPRITRAAEADRARCGHKQPVKRGRRDEATGPSAADQLYLPRSKLSENRKYLACVLRVRIGMPFGKYQFRRHWLPIPGDGLPHGYHSFGPTGK